jgi:hypothetical protein
VIAESLATGTEPLIAAEHALHVLEIIEAARASGQSGRKVPLVSTFKWPVVWSHVDNPEEPRLKFFARVAPEE